MSSALALLKLLLLVELVSQRSQAAGVHQPSAVAPLVEPQAPLITPFAFNQNVLENQRASILCTISSGDLPLTFSWLKDGQLLTPQLAQLKRVSIKYEPDQSILKFASVRLDHAGNYTCVAQNRAGLQAHSSQLVVHGEPRWLREPIDEPIVATRGQTVVIDCQTTGWPRPQQSWQIKSKYLCVYVSAGSCGALSRFRRQRSAADEHALRSGAVPLPTSVCCTFVCR